MTEPAIQNPTPIADTSAEAATLSGVLNHADRVLPEAATIIQAGDFFDQRNALVYRVALELMAESQPVDPVTVATRLGDRDLLKRLGGPGYVLQLSGRLISPAQAVHYAQEVRNQANARQIEKTLRRALSNLQASRHNPGLAVEEAERAISEMQARHSRGQTKAMADVVERAYAAFERRREAGKDVDALPTGFDAVDRIMGGGMRPADLIIPAGRPGMGKTSWCLAVAAHVGIALGQGVLFCSREQRAEQLVGNLFCRQGRVNTQAWRTGKVNRVDLTNIQNQRKWMAQAPIEWLDRGGDLKTVVSQARLLKARGKLRLVIIDYIQRFAKRQNAEEIGHVTTTLKDLGLDLEVPVIAASQLNREIEKREDKRPTPSDLRGSGDLEQDADIIFMFYRPGVYDGTPDDTRVDLLVAKQRSGDAMGSVELRFIQEMVRYENAEHVKRQREMY